MRIPWPHSKPQLDAASDLLRLIELTEPQGPAKSALSFSSPYPHRQAFKVAPSRSASVDQGLLLDLESMWSTGCAQSCSSFTFQDRKSNKCRSTSLSEVANAYFGCSFCSGYRFMLHPLCSSISDYLSKGVSENKGLVTFP